MDLLLKRRQMMSQGEVEKLDYLTIIPDSVPAKLTLDFPYIVYDDGDERWEEYQPIDISEDNGDTWVRYGDWEINRVTISISGPIKIKANFKMSWLDDYYFLTSPRLNVNTTFTVEGSPMSLCYGDDFDSYTGEQTCSFYRMFSNSNIRRINNPKTFLPATSFKYSDNTTNSNPAYEEMFKYCSKLENAPEINLVNIGLRDCSHMFFDCNRLIEASAINSLTVGLYGCYYMYSACKNLVKAQDVLPMAIKGNGCYSGMFMNCTSLERAPELPFLQLWSRCYDSMFHGCSKLNYIKAMFTTTPSTSYTYYWVYGVASTGTFVKNKDATWNVSGVSGIPSGWTVISE